MTRDPEDPTRLELNLSHRLQGESKAYKTLEQHGLLAFVFDKLLSILCGIGDRLHVSQAFAWWSSNSMSLNHSRCLKEEQVV